MALSDSLAVIAICAFAHGFGLEVFSVGLDLSIQQHIPEDMLSRVYAFVLAGAFVARAIGLAVTGAVAAYAGFHAWPRVLATAMLLSIATSLLSPAVRTLPRRDPVVDSASAG